MLSKLSENIIFYRKAAKMTQNDLAAALGVTRTTITHYENKDSEPDIDTLIKLAEILDVTLDELVGIILIIVRK